MTVSADIQGEHSRQIGFFNMICEGLSPPDHLSYKLAAVVDFSFVADLVSHLWWLPHTGLLPKLPLCFTYVTRFVTFVAFPPALPGAPMCCPRLPQVPKLAIEAGVSQGWRRSRAGSLRGFSVDNVVARGRELVSK